MRCADFTGNLRGLQGLTLQTQKKAMEKSHIRRNGKESA